MRHDIDRYKRMKYLKAIARVQWEYREFLANTDQKLLPQGLRTKDMQDFMVKANATPPALSYRRDNENSIRRLVTLVFTRSDRDGIKTEVGGKPSGEKGYRHHMIRVGYMWVYKVYNNFYKNTKLDRSMRNRLILSAERVRLNHKSIVIWEAQSYTKDGVQQTGYVAQAKTEARHTAFHQKAHLAVRTVEDMMSKDINAVLGIN